MKIEIDKEDFVKLAVYASWAYLPDEEDKCEMTLRKIMDSLDKEDAAKITIDILALRTKIALLSGVNVEEVVKTLMECVMEEDDEELDLDENDGDVLKRIMKEDDE
ncbi:hypothetical protein [Ligilactobacillus ruminis]|uniref:hypothetical protein n=1 Tax=Ligilactobacillus ruminis TaxID=1623 RepID=UPI0022E1706F|nr:hypothetical protein [Ligilactobacillus ruminis]